MFLFNYEFHVVQFDRVNEGENRDDRTLLPKL